MNINLTNYVGTTNKLSVGNTIYVVILSNFE